MTAVAAIAAAPAARGSGAAGKPQTPPAADEALDLQTWMQRVQQILSDTAHLDYAAECGCDPNRLAQLLRALSRGQQYLAHARGEAQRELFASWREYLGAYGRAAHAQWDAEQFKAFMTAGMQLLVGAASEAFDAFVVDPKLVRWGRDWYKAGERLQGQLGSEGLKSGVGEMYKKLGKALAGPKAAGQAAEGVVERANLGTLLVRAAKAGGGQPLEDASKAVAIALSTAWAGGTGLDLEEVYDPLRRMATAGAQLAEINAMDALLRSRLEGLWRRVASDSACLRRLSSGCSGAHRPPREVDWITAAGRMPQIEIRGDWRSEVEALERIARSVARDARSGVAHGRIDCGCLWPLLRAVRRLHALQDYARNEAKAALAVLHQDILPTYAQMFDLMLKSLRTDRSYSPSDAEQWAMFALAVMPGGGVMTGAVEAAETLAQYYLTKGSLASDLMDMIRETHAPAMQRIEPVIRGYDGLAARLQDLEKKLWASLADLHCDPCPKAVPVRSAVNDKDRCAGRKVLLRGGLIPLERPRAPRTPGPAPPKEGVPGREPRKPARRPGPEPEETAKAPPQGVPAPDESPRTPAPPVPVFVKAKQSVLDAAGRQSDTALAGATVKLLTGPPPLPLAGNPRDDDGYDRPPAMGETGPSGSVGIPFDAPGGYLPADEPLELTVDRTPQEEVIVRLPGDAEVDEKLEPYVERAWRMNGDRYLALRYPVALGALVREWLDKAGVIYVEPDPCRDKAVEVDDPYFLATGSWGQPWPDQWAIQRVGYTAGEDSAWEAAGKPTQPVVVALVDTGLDWNHRDLAWESIWRNPDEQPDNGLDDDGNGYVDDVIGWNFVDADPAPWDEDGHGTFTAGIIAAIRNNGIGIAGIAPEARIMVLKALDSFGHSRASLLAEAIAYAADKGARVINLSVAGPSLTRTEREAVDYAWSRGAVVVAAAGNDAAEVNDYGPAGIDRVVTVAATDFEDHRAGFSNWGGPIDIAAPGMDVLSLRARRTDLMASIEGVDYEPGAAFVGPDRRYYRASGTSFAAPIVSATAALILARRPELRPEQVVRMLLQSARDIDVPGRDQHTGYGLLDARAALRADPEFFVEARIDGVEVVRDASGSPALRVRGTADADHFERAFIEIGAGGSPEVWRPVGAELRQPVAGDTLAEIPASEFAGSSEWLIRLRVRHEGGRSREARYHLELE